MNFLLYVRIFNDQGGHVEASGRQAPRPALRLIGYDQGTNTDIVWRGS
jgi:hypothetical protein